MDPALGEEGGVRGGREGEGAWGKRGREGEDGVRGEGGWRWIWELGFSLYTGAG